MKWLSNSNIALSLPVEIDEDVPMQHIVALTQSHENYIQWNLRTRDNEFVPCREGENIKISLATRCWWFTIVL